MEIDGNGEYGPLKKGIIGVAVGDFKYIYNLTKRRDELYNIKLDPGESNNLATMNRNVSSYCKKLIFDNIVNNKQ
jgi:hypothetical protein